MDLRELAKEAADESERLYNVATEHGCECDKAEHCAHCSLWEAATNRSRRLILHALETAVGEIQADTAQARYAHETACDEIARLNLVLEQARKAGQKEL